MTEMDTEKQLIEIVKNYLDGANASHTKYGCKQIGDNRFSCLVSGFEGSVFNELHILLTVKENCVVSECFLPVSAKPEVFTDVAEYFMRINHMAARGYLLLDYENGFMRYELIIDDAALLYEAHRERAMRYLLEIGPYMFDQIGDSLTAILFGGKNGRTVKEIIEKDLADREEEENDDPGEEKE